jgi:hypothetical protein
MHHHPHHLPLLSLPHLKTLLHPLPPVHTIILHPVLSMSAAAAAHLPIDIT